MLTVFFMKLRFKKNFNYHIHKIGKGSADICVCYPQSPDIVSVIHSVLTFVSAIHGVECLQLFGRDTF